MRARRPSLLVIVCAALALGGVASVIARALDGGAEPAPGEEVSSPVRTTTASGASTSSSSGRGSRSSGARRKRSQRDAEARESRDRESRATAHAHAPALPAAVGAGSGAAEPVAVAERFARAWANRAGSRRALRRQRAELVSLSTGMWAGEVRAEFSQAIDSGGGQAGSQGTLVVSKLLRSSPESAEVLVVVRERALVSGRTIEPYRYATYLARLVAVKGGFAVASWEPQQ